MANNKLYGEYFSLSPIKQDIDNYYKKYGDKSEFLKHVISGENKPEYSISYSYAKKIKHQFENKFDDNEKELHGGVVMKNFINNLLSNKRTQIIRHKKVKSNIGMENQFLKTHNKSYIKPQNTNVLNSGKEKIELTEWILNEEENICACICIILNDKKEILLLKRRPNDGWMPGKYAIVGGKLEKGEDKYECVLREILEETNLELKSVTYLFNKIEGDYSVDVFIGYTDKPEQLILSDEHTDYVWANSSNIRDLDLVPDMISDIEKGLKIFMNKNKNLSI